MSQAQILWHIVVTPALHPDGVVGHFLMTWPPLQLRVEGAPVANWNHTVDFAVHDQHGACDTANFLVAPKNIHRV